MARATRSAARPARRSVPSTSKPTCRPAVLAGNVYLGKANGTSSITGPPYLIFIDTESVYDVSVRLEGQAVPNPTTGRLEVSFLGNPQLPFSDLTLTLNGGPRAPLANPLVCGSAPTEAMFSPYTTGILQALTPTSYITTGCPSSIPFALTQSATPANTTAGAYSPYTFNLSRADGQQYLSQVSTTLPAGLLGAIPSVTLCGEPQAAAGHLHRGEPDRRRHGHRGRRQRTVSRSPGTST